MPAGVRDDYPLRVYDTRLEPSFAAKLDRLRNKKKRNFGPIASGRLIAILLVFLTIGVLELTRIYPLSEKLGALVANATGSAEFEQPGKNGGRDVRNPEDLADLLVPDDLEDQSGGDVLPAIAVEIAHADGRGGRSCSPTCRT